MEAPNMLISRSNDQKEKNLILCDYQVTMTKQQKNYAGA